MNNIVTIKNDYANPSFVSKLKCLFTLGCIKYNFDSPGHDVASFLFTPSATACQEACQKDRRCNHFQFKRGFKFGTINVCWLKSQLADILEPKDGFVLGPKRCGRL